MIYLVRHGQTKCNAERKYYGATESPLTEIGMEQSSKAIKSLSQYHIDVIISSPRQRCTYIAEAVAKKMGIETIVDDRVEEYNFGIFEDTNQDEIVKKYPNEYKSWINNETYCLPGGESKDAMHERVFNFAADLLSKYKGKDILIITHHGVIKALICNLLNLTSDKEWNFFIKNTGMVKIKIKNDFAYLVLE